MKLNPTWIRNVVTDTTRRTEKQQLWAKAAACRGSLRAHPRTHAILRNTHLSGVSPESGLQRPPPPNPVPRF